MKKRILIISSVIALIIFGLTSYYRSKTESSRAFATRLMSVIVPYAEFEDVSLTNAANQIWMETISIDPFFADKRIVIDLEHPERHTIPEFKLAHCPTREWFNYLCQITRTNYQIFDDVIYITDRGWEHDYRPWFFGAVESVDLWFYSMLRRFGREDPNDPFASSKTEPNKASIVSLITFRVDRLT